jgi:hypothetical protein
VPLLIIPAEALGRAVLCLLGFACYYYYDGSIAIDAIISSEFANSSALGLSDVSNGHRSFFRAAFVTMSQVRSNAASRMKYPL